ncbi:MAG: hypothetical protein ACK5NE_09480 [Brachymonas sp.]
MSNVVDICNLALAHLGDDATVSSIDPPEGSAQAEHCARFYPIARDSLLEMHAWGFATRRAELAQLITPSWGWSFAYARPAGALRILAVLPPGAKGDAQTEDYELECDANGKPLIFTNQEQASARYTVPVTDPSVFSPLFVDALAWLLASHLAGPVLKGEAGASMAASCLKLCAQVLGSARVSDANQQHTQRPHTPVWIKGR